MGIYCSNKTVTTGKPVLNLLYNPELRIISHTGQRQVTTLSFKAEYITKQNHSTPKCSYEAAPRNERNKTSRQTFHFHSVTHKDQIVRIQNKTRINTSAVNGFSILYRNDVFEKKNELHKVMCFKVLLKYLTKLILLSGEKITYILMETMKKFV